MKLLTILICCSLPLFGSAQPVFEYEPNEEYPFGRANPAAPSEIGNYDGLLGICNCKSYRSNPDGTWQAPIDMTWEFSYIMNGMAVQDKTLKADGGHSGSIRQYDADSARWNVHYYANNAPSTAPLSVWTGSKEKDKIVLYRDQPSPQGIDGYSRLTFYDISATGYKWIGEWSDVNETVVFPFWKIDCLRE